MQNNAQWNKFISSGKPRRIKVCCILEFGLKKKYFATGSANIINAKSVFRAGTVDCTFGSKTVTRPGGEAAFGSDVVKSGVYFRVDGGRLFKVDNLVTGGMSFLLSEPFDGTTGNYQYEIIYDFESLKFVSGMTISSYPGASIDIDAMTSQIGSMSLEITGQARLQDLVTGNVALSNGRAEIRLIQEGLLWNDGPVLLKGVARDISWGTDDTPFSFTVIESRLSKDKRFPPVKIKSENFPLAPPEVIGNAYPILYGSFVESPCYFLGLINANNRYMVAGHNINKITKSYHDGIEFSPANTGLAVDGDGKSYYYIDTPLAITTEQITATGEGLAVDGSFVSDLGEVLEDMIVSYSGLLSTEIDSASFDRIKSALSGWKVSSIFNGSGNNSSTVFETIQQRFAQQFSVIPFVQGGEYGLILMPLRDPPIALHLRYGKNIIRRESPVLESDINKVFNSFELQYAYNPRLNTYTKIKHLTKDNSALLEDSYNRYGELEAPTFTAPDIQDDAMAAKLLRYKELYLSKTALLISYLCTMETSELVLGNFVKVTDNKLGWNDKNFFIVAKDLRQNSNHLMLRESPI